MRRGLKSFLGIALASAILACIVLITRPLSEYAECW